MEIIDYKNKNILAPMVRCGTLAFRLLALEYGADLVYTEEIIDYKMVNAKRSRNELFNLIDYSVDGTEKPLFQTCEKEKGKVIFQIGTNNAERALRACKLVEDDVAGIDVNMGCPKEFSVQGGMGAALLKRPETVKEILTTLVNGLSKPVTCKIRCLPSLEETLELCKLIESCGVKAIAVHGRFQEERSRNPNRNDYIREIRKILKIPVIANGGSNEIKCYEDILKFRDECQANSVMVARAAMWNCSIFRKEGTLPLDDVIKRYLEISLEVDNYFFSTKYSVQQMLHEELTSERGVAVLASLAGEEIYKQFEMLNEYNELQKKKEEYFNTTVIKRNLEELENEEKSKKLKSESNENENDKKLIIKHAKFLKKEFRDGKYTPKSILNTHCTHNKLINPVYRTEEKLPEKVYKCVMEFQHIFYTTPYWEPSKQLTEQAAAMVCLESIGVDYKKFSYSQLNKN